MTAVIDELRRAGPRSSGYAVALVGAIMLAVSYLMPRPGQVGLGWSYFRVLTFDRSGLEVVGALLNLFGASTVLAAICVSGVRRPRVWMIPGMAVLALTLSLSRLGSLVSGHPPGLEDVPYGAAYWVELASVAVMLAGAALVGRSSRRSEAASDPHADGNDRRLVPRPDV